MEQWYAAYETKTGNLISVGTVLPDVIPDHLSVIKLPPDYDYSIPADWDSVNLVFVPKPSPLMLTKDDVANKIVAALPQLDKTTQTAVLQAIKENL